MPQFGARSLEQRATLDSRLQAIVDRAIEVFDFTITEGHRSNARQDLLFSQGKSQLRGGQSKHNTFPSRAMDLAPYPIVWRESERFYVLAGVIFAVANELGIRIRWGGDWDRDWDLYDSSFLDLPHFELIDP